MRSQRGGGLHLLVGELKVGDRSGMPAAEKRLNLVRHAPCVMMMVTIFGLCRKVLVTYSFRAGRSLCKRSSLVSVDGQCFFVPGRLGFESSGCFL